MKSQSDHREYYMYVYIGESVVFGWTKVSQIWIDQDKWTEGWGQCKEGVFVMLLSLYFNGDRHHFLGYHHFLKSIQWVLLVLSGTHYGY